MSGKTAAALGRARTAIGALCVAWVVFAATTARADDPARAKAMYDEGVRHYDAGEYEAAIRAFDAAYALAHAPLLLFNIGQSYRLSGNCAAALDYYARYTQAVAAPDNRGELDDAVAKCKAQPPTQPPTPPVAPTAVTQTAPVAAVASSVTVTTPAPRRGRRLAGYALGVGGIAAGVAATYFTIDGAKLSSQEMKTTNWAETDIRAQARGVRDNVLAWTFGGVGAAALGVGIALVVTSRSSERAVAIAPVPGGAELAIGARF